MTSVTLGPTFPRNPCLVVAFLVALSHFVVSDVHDGMYVVDLGIDTFKAALNKNKHFTMFYAPWCGHCKNLAPTWDELAKLHNVGQGGAVVISKVDCTVHTKLCTDQEIVGFPTLKLFSVDGADPKRYSGKRDLDSLRTYLVKMLKEPLPQAKEEDKVGDLEHDENAFPEAASGPVTLTDTTFEEFVISGFHFVKFYVPWCGHCKRLAPTWDDLAQSLKDNEDISIIKIDCEANPLACSKHSIRGYPTLLIINDGEKITAYEGERSLSSLKEFAVKEYGKLYGEEDIHPDEDVAVEAYPEQGQVVELTANNFDSFLSSKLVFVKFYAPWCGHCKRLAPTWDDLAKELEMEEVAIAKVDCTLHKPVCDGHQVRGYPTLKIFRNGEHLEDYRQSRSLENLASFVRDHIKKHDEL